MGFVVVTKRIKDLKKIPKELYGVDPEFPLDCAEYLTRDEAETKHPGAAIVTSEEYNAHKSEMDGIYEKTWKKIPWWMVWRRT